MANPFVKWAGGKRQVMSHLLARVPTRFERYHEPFLGGGALFWSLVERDPFVRTRGVVLSDLNGELVVSYAAVRDQVDEVVRVLREYAERVSKGETRAVFDELQPQDWAKLSPAMAAARMIFLNKTCYNGLYRLNRKGGFNTPFGKSKKPPNVCDEANLRACSEALQGVEVVCSDFRQAALRVRKGDFVYFDPPYLPRLDGKVASFTKFTAEPFGFEEHQALAKLARKLRRRGAHVLLSNAQCEAADELYADWRRDVVEARRNVNSATGSRGAVGEYVIS